MKAAVGEYRQPKCNTTSDPQPVKTLQQWTDVVATTSGKYQAISEWKRIPERSSHNILPMEGLAGKITSSLHESNFACYNCINGIALQMNTILRLITV